MSRGHFIGLNHHRLMLADRLRMDAYERAIAERVKPGMRVMDLGTGTGILAMWAARAGAEVVAVEPHAVIEVAKRVAADNDLANKITFVRGDSRTIDAQAVDLVITECMGNFFVTDEMQPVLRDLPRHLRAGGQTMPRRIVLKLAAATLPLWRELSFWQDEIGGFDFTGASDFAEQAAYVIHCEPEFVATRRATVADFALIDSPDVLDLQATLEVTRACTLHGLIGWFDADLAEDVVLSTEPGKKTHWGQMVFPLPPTSVRPGDRVEARVELAMESASGGSQASANQGSPSGGSQASANQGSPSGGSQASANQGSPSGGSQASANQGSASGGSHASANQGSGLRSHFRWRGKILTAGGEVAFDRDTRQRFGGAT